MPETRTLEIPVYRTPDGKPTCSRDVVTGEMCRFAFVRGFGCIDFCGAVPRSERDDDVLRRVPRDTGYLVPHKDCPLWADPRESTEYGST